MAFVRGHSDHNSKVNSSNKALALAAGPRWFCRATMASSIAHECYIEQRIVQMARAVNVILILNA